MTEKSLAALGVGLACGLAIGYFAWRGPSPGILEETSVRRELLSLSPREWVEIWQRSQELLSPWPKCSPVLESLLEEEAPQLQLAGLYALTPHRDDAPERLLRKARSLQASRFPRIRMGAISFLPENDREGAYLRLAEEQMKAYGVGIAQRNTGSPIIVSLADILSSYRDEAAEEMLCRMLSTGDYGLVPRASKELLDRKSRLAIRSAVDYLGTLLVEHRSERVGAARRFELLTGFLLPSGFRDDADWQHKALPTMRTWLKEHPGILDQTQPIPPLSLPPDPNAPEIGPEGPRPFDAIVPSSDF